MEPPAFAEWRRTAGRSPRLRTTSSRRHQSGRRHLRLRPCGRRHVQGERRRRRPTGERRQRDPRGLRGRPERGLLQLTPRTSSPATRPESRRLRPRPRGITERVSVDSSGVERGATASRWLSISADGRFVVFESSPRTSSPATRTGSRRLRPRPPPGHANGSASTRRAWRERPHLLFVDFRRRPVRRVRERGHESRSRRHERGTRRLRARPATGITERVSVDSSGRGGGRRQRLARSVDFGRRAGCGVREPRLEPRGRRYERDSRRLRPWPDRVRARPTAASTGQEVPCSEAARAAVGGRVGPASAMRTARSAGSSACARLG